jgi:uncharacterized protein (TIGR00266 family)
MKIDIKGEGAFSSALVEFDGGERFMSESGAMFHTTSNVDIDVTTRTRGGGGILKGIKRMLAADSFFLSTYTSTDGAPGQVALSPTLQGEVKVVEMDGSSRWLCAGGSYLASTEDLELDSQFQGFKGMFSGESLFFLEVSGRGSLLVSAFGRIVEEQCEGELIVDTGHLVAFEDSLEYSLSKAGGSWRHSFFAGEGIIMKFRGRGRVLVQSHNPSAFGRELGRLLPPRKK